MRRTIYLAYGSNLNVEQMKYRCPDAAKIGAGVIENYMLNFRGTRRGAGFANIERSKGDKVPVGIWAISRNDEMSLDMYEGYPHLYIKDYVQFTYKDETYEGLVYIMRPGHPVMMPAAWYERTIRDGYNDFGISEKILDKAIKNTKEMKRKSDEWRISYTLNGDYYNYKLV